MEPTATRKRIELVYDNSRAGRALARRFLQPALGIGSARQLELVTRVGQGRAVLECGSGDGRFAIGQGIARQAARYHGIDLSVRAVRRARERARSLGLRHCHFDTMDVESMRFPDNHFDVVFGRGILHHMDLGRSLAEIQRVLRPNGTAVFYEPMGHNPWLSRLQIAPRAIPLEEHPLVVNDFRLARRFFDHVETRFYGFTTLAPAQLPASPLRERLIRACQHVDDWLLRLPWIGRNACSVLLTFSK